MASASASSLSFNEWNNVPSSPFNGNPCNNGNSLVPVASAPPSATELAMKHNPGISLEWTMEEQAVLEDGLVRFALESNLARYARIAIQLQNKTIRDVALRVRWMNKIENCKRRKDDLKLTRKSKDKKESVSGPAAMSSRLVARPSVSPHAPGMAMMNNNGGMFYKAIGGPIGALLEQNAQALNQISKNLASRKCQENIKLFHQTRDNIIKIMNHLNDTPDLVKQMPPLPVNLDEIDEMDEMASGELHTSRTDFAPLECQIQLRGQGVWG